MSWKSVALRPLLDVANRARTREYRRVHRRILDEVPDVRDALDTVGERWHLPTGSLERPIFLLASGWRSGSTVLQRLIMSVGDPLIWGEPYARCGYVQQMSEALRALGADYPREDYFLANREGDLANQWIANLFPEVEDVKAAHRAFFDRLLAEPASARGYMRWGLKEVRLTVGHAHYLRWLYPDAKLVFLVRDPLASYRSYARVGPAFARWPEQAVITATEFGRHWARLAEGFLHGAQEVGGLLVRFEELFEPRGAALSELEGHLDLPLDPEVLNCRIGGSTPAADALSLSRLDRRAIVNETRNVAPRLGYGHARALA